MHHMVSSVTLKCLRMCSSSQAFSRSSALKPASLIVLKHEDATAPSGDGRQNWEEPYQSQVPHGHRRSHAIWRELVAHRESSADTASGPALPPAGFFLVLSCLILFLSGAGQP